jgi:hypothetical protein
MHISIACPCGARLRAPDAAAGKTFKCPKCGRSILVPAGDAAEPLPAEPAPYAVAAPPSPPPVRATKACPYCGETILAVARLCKHCGQALDPDLRGQPPGRGKRRDKEDHDDEDDRPRQDRRGAEVAGGPREGGAAAHSLGIASLVLGVLAFLVSLIPCIGVVGLPIGGLGLLLGIAGLIVALVRQGRGIGFPIAGSGVSLLALVIAGVWLAAANKVAESVQGVADATSTTPASKAAPAPPAPSSAPAPAPAGPIPASGPDPGPSNRAAGTGGNGRTLGYRW